ncbi:NAD-binding Rossmann fold glucose/fructose oxidoreductase family protein [alpha proteobacterium HIMB5]|nr:NAD-binding Rossmann fold glucose/fructose oxidoreductase family protein [alpha proteobacterium HIMB5]
MKIVKIGIVGCGRVFEHYKKIFKKRKVNDFKIIVVCDLKLNTAKKASKYFKCDFTLDYSHMLNEYKDKIDLIIILSPSGLHFKHSKLALQNDCHVLCEKPVTMIPSDVKILKSLSKRKKLMFGIVFQNRFNKSIQTLKRFFDKGKFGKLSIINVRLLWSRYQKYYNDEWHGTWENDGGVTNQQAIHHIDVARWIFGPIQEVNSIMSNQINNLQAEDTNNAILKFKNGAVGSIQATTSVRPADLTASLEVIGEKGFMVIGGIALNRIEKFYFKRLSKYEKKLLKSSNEIVENGYGNSHTIILDYAIKNILKKNNKFPISLNDGYDTSILVHALYKSDEKRKWIKLSNNIKSNRLGVLGVK